MPCKAHFYFPDSLVHSVRYSHKISAMCLKGSDPLYMGNGFDAATLGVGQVVEQVLRNLKVPQGVAGRIGDGASIIYNNRGSDPNTDALK